MADSEYYDEGISGSTFLFEVDGLEIGRFMEVGGLELQIGVETVEEGGQNGFSHQLPGRMSWPNISLKRGVTQSDNLFTWVTKSSGEQFASAGNKLTRATAAITLIGPKGQRLRAWNFVDAFPVKWTGPSFAADSTGSVFEQLEIAHHGFTAKNL